MKIALKLRVKFLLMTVILISLTACDSSPIQHLGINRDYQRTISEFTPHTELKLRQATISDLYYEVNIDLTQFGRYAGMVELRFMYKPTQYPLTIDFANGEVERILLNNKPVAIDYNGQYLTIPANQMTEGTNRIKIQFSRAFVKNQPGLNHYYDTTDGRHYLFSKSELQSEHHLFPMFNQPDLPLKLKAIFTTDKHWSLLSSLDSEKVVERGDFKLWYFQNESTTTDDITLLAGEWYEWKGKADGQQVRILVRQSAKESIPVRRWYHGIENAIKPLYEYFDRNSSTPLNIALLPGLYHYQKSTKNILAVSENPMLFDSHMSPAWHRILTRHEVSKQLRNKRVADRWLKQWLTTELSARLFPEPTPASMPSHHRLQPSLNILSSRYPETYARLLNHSLLSQKAPQLLRGLATLSETESVSNALYMFLNDSEATFTNVLENISTLSSFNAVRWASEWLNKPGAVKLSVARQCNQYDLIETLKIQQVTQQEYPVVRPLQLMISNPLWDQPLLMIDMTSQKKIITELPDTDCDAVLIVSTYPGLYIETDNTSDQIRRLSTNYPKLNILQLLQLAMHSTEGIQPDELLPWLNLIQTRLAGLNISDISQLINTIQPMVETVDNEEINNALEAVSNQLFQLSLARSADIDIRVGWLLLHLQTITNDTQINRMLAWLFGNSQPNDLQGVESLQLAVIKLIAKSGNADIKLILDSFKSRGYTLYNPYIDAIKQQTDASFNRVNFLQTLITSDSQYPTKFAPILFDDDFINDSSVTRYSIENIVALESSMSAEILQRWLEPHLMTSCNHVEEIKKSLSSKQIQQTRQSTRDWLQQVLVSCKAKQELAIY